MGDNVNPRAHACQNCVKAKAKCYGQTDGRCERCYRLNRNCGIQDRGTRSKSTKPRCRRGDQARQIAQLEQKLDSLVSLLGVSQSGFDHERATVITPDSTGPTTDSFISTNRRIDFPLREYHVPSARGEAVPMVEVAAFDPSQGKNAKSPDELLAIFRCDMLYQVPFISIPSHISAQAMSRESPFLYRAITTVASYHDSLHQLQLGESLLEYITKHLIVLGEKSMDILQGLLVYITWYNNLFHTNPQTNTLLGLAFSLLVDLNLYMKFKPSKVHEKFVGEMKIAITCNPNWTRTSEPSKEEMRAVLGCFYLFSTVSSKFRSLNPLQWTPHIQHCYESILKTPENENDVRLVHLLDLQRIAESAKYITSREFSPPKPNDAHSSLHIYFKLLVSDLQQYKSTLPERFHGDSMMLMHYHATEILVSELCFLMPPTSPTHLPSFQRSDALIMCLTATRALIDTYVSVDSEPHVGFSSVSVAQIYLAMATLSKLLLFKADDWEGIYVQPSEDLATLLDSVISRMEERSSRYDLAEDNKPWLRTSRRMRQVRDRLDNLLANDISISVVPPTEQSLNGSLAASFHLDRFGLLDDRFWEGMIDDATAVK